MSSVLSVLVLLSHLYLSVTGSRDVGHRILDDEPPDLEHNCPLRHAFLPGILENLAPWLDGITDQHIEAGADSLKYEVFEMYNFQASDDFQKINQTALEVLSPSDVNYPWSSANLVKVICIDNTWYLPGGKIPVAPHGNGLLAGHGSYAQPLRDLIALSKRFRLPDMVLLYSSGDFPIVYGPSSNGHIPPVFHPSAQKEAYEIPLPDSYPEVYVPDHPFDTEWPEFVEKHSLPWDQRKNVALGRYNDMCPRAPILNRTHQELGCPRQAIHYLLNNSRNHDYILDAGLTRNTNSNMPYVHWEEQFSYKYYLHLDGAAVSFRLPHLLAGGWTVITLASSPLYSWFTHLLKPWVHYVPFGYDSYEELFTVINFLNKSPKLAEHIARAGQRFAHEYLSLAGRECYTLTLLQEYKRLLQINVGKLSDYPNAVLVEDALKEGQSEVQRWISWAREQNLDV